MLMRNFPYYFDILEKNIAISGPYCKDLKDIPKACLWALNTFQSTEGKPPLSYSGSYPVYCL